MTEAEVKAVYAKLEQAADNLTEYGDDVLVMMLIQHEPDQGHGKATRQLLFVGRGNWWARLGMAHDYLKRMGEAEDEAKDELE